MVCKVKLKNYYKKIIVLVTNCFLLDKINII